jgi:hypothetical protein
MDVARTNIEFQGNSAKFRPRANESIEQLGPRALFEMPARRAFGFHG